MPRKGHKKVEKTANALQVLKVEYVPIDSILPNTYNPNRQSEHEFELLCRSMREDGFTQPIIVQSSTRQIVDGEHRWRAANALHFTEIPVVFVDMTVEQMKIATLRHNRARGTEDIDLTAKVMQDLRQLGALDWAQDSLMLDDIEMQRLLDDKSAAEALANEEFSEAWTPGDSETVLSNTDNRSDSMSPDALEAIRKQEEALRTAKTEADRQKVRQELDVYRVNLIFTKDEAKIVRDVLGAQPALVILAWCKEHAVPKPVTNGTNGKRKSKPQQPDIVA